MKYGPLINPVPSAKIDVFELLHLVHIGQGELKS